MAVAISGCIIEEETAMHIKYKRKCDKCGYVLPGSTTTGTVSKHSKKTSSFMCPKCKTTVKLVIQG